MIWRLFKRKPIYQVTIPNVMTKEEYNATKQNLQSTLGKDYYVVILFDTHKTYMETKLL
jgi:hypothetical protein